MRLRRLWLRKRSTSRPELEHGRVVIESCEPYSGRPCCLIFRGRIKFYRLNRLGRFAPDLAVLRDDSDREVQTSSFARDGSWVEFAFNIADLPKLEADTQETWRFYLSHAGEQRRLVHWNSLLTPVNGREDGLVLAAGPSGVVRLDRLQHTVEASAVDFYPSPSPHLTITGSYAGGHSKPVSMSLGWAGPTLLRVTRLLTKPVALYFRFPSSSRRGRGRLDSVGRIPYWSSVRRRIIRAVAACEGDDRQPVQIALFRTPQRPLGAFSGQRSLCEFSPPLLPQELGEYNQRKLSVATKKSSRSLEEDSFDFESWFGKYFSDSLLVSL